MRISYPAHLSLLCFFRGDLSGRMENRAEDVLFPCTYRKARILPSPLLVRPRSALDSLETDRLPTISRALQELSIISDSASPSTAHAPGHAHTLRVCGLGR